MAYTILCVNPGSTSTKIALYDDLDERWKVTIEHPAEQLARFDCNNDQIPMRTQAILDALAEHGVGLEDIDAFSGRGGGQCSHLGGTYLVNQLMVDEAHDEVYACHPALLACQICYALGERTGKPAYMTNSPATDEMRQIARLTGLAGTYRICYAHALNQKEVAQRYAAGVGRPYESMNLIVCHIGGGVSVSAHQRGRIVDTNDILNGDGPMAPNRTGSIPAQDMVNFCYDAQEKGWSRTEASRFVRGKGGWLDLLGTYDAREVGARIAAGDTYAKNVYDAFIYQVAKYVGSMSVALEGPVDAILLTGGIAHDGYVVEGVRRWAGKIAPVVAMPGEYEMEALAHGAYQALAEGKVCEYTGVPVWTPAMLHEVAEA